MVHRAGSNSGVRVAIANTRCKFLVCHMKFCNRTKTSVPNGGKTGHGIYRLDKNSVLSYLYDKDQEGLENLIEARNKHRMLRTHKERTAFMTRVARMLKYSHKHVIRQLRNNKKKLRGGEERLGS